MMSVGHLKGERREPGELYPVLGENDTSKWYAKPKKLITDKDTPYGGGSSVDASEIYIDQQLYLEVMCSPKVERHLWVIVKGMTGAQIIRAWVEHEGTEIAVELGDNACDTYQACHGMAQRMEDDDVDVMIGNHDRYENAIKPALKRCLQRSVNKIKAGTFNPPKKLWCGPYLDDPDATDRILIRGFKAKGVTDAFKLSKSDPTVMYGMGGQKCRECAMMEKPKADLSPCDLVAGMVRWNRQCKRWVER